MAEKVTFCRICEPLCGMVATVEDGKLVSLRADKDNPHSKGFCCAKGVAMAQVAQRSRPRPRPAQADRRPRRVRAGVVGRGPR